MQTYEASRAFVNARGIRFHCELDGDDDKPVLALINMASHNLTCWEVVLEKLLPSFRVLRHDIRGTGKSGVGEKGEFTFRDYADDLAAIMDSLSLDQAYVVGVAYGARTAARFALHHHDRLTALGLFDVALTPPVEQSGQRDLGRSARTLLEEAGEPAVVARKYWRFYEDREAARLAHTAHEQETDPTDLLASVEVPTLVACGRQDANLPEAERIAAAIPHAEFTIMEMTGHGSLFFRPALFAELVTSFWQRCVDG